MMLRSWRTCWPSRCRCRSAPVIACGPLGLFLTQRLSTSGVLFASMSSCAATQDKPYALFGTCLGAIVAYEVTRQVQERKHAPMPVAFFPSAVSAPHLYAIAVMKLYVQHQVGAPCTGLSAVMRTSTQDHGI